MFTKYTKNKCFTTTVNLIVHALTSAIFLRMKNLNAGHFFGAGDHQHNEVKKWKVTLALMMRMKRLMSQYGWRIYEIGDNSS